MELRPRKEMAMTAGGLGCPLVTPTSTTVIATHTNIKFSAWFRNVFPDFTIGIFPIPSDSYQLRPRKDKRGVDLISDALPFGRLWYGEPERADSFASILPPFEER